jgi:hypothetical protein
MLNELHLLERGLAEHGLGTVAHHPDLSQLLKGDVIRVRLDGGGIIDELELLPKKTRKDVWTLRDGKHNGFPGLKTARGLLALDRDMKAAHDAAWKATRNAVAKRAEIERLIQSVPADPDLGEWPKPGHRTRIAERHKQLQSLGNDTSTAAVPAVFERFLRALGRQPPFLSEMLQRLIERARNGEDEWLDAIRAALVGAAPLAVDIARGDFPRDVGDARQVEAVSRALAAAESDGTPNEGGSCAFTGRLTRLLEGPFPQPTLPSLGQTYLFSRNTDIPALARYGRNGPTSFPVGADLVSRFSGALSAVTIEERRGKTWRLLPAEAGDEQDLLIAVVASAMDEPVANSLAADAENDDIEEKPDGRLVLEQTGKDLIRLWQGIASKAKPGEAARILILHTVDPGNRKAVYDRRPTVQALDRAARDWAKAMANAPQWVALPIFVKRRQATGRPKLQAPLSLIPLSRKLYIRGGREAANAPGVSGAAALALFLGEGNRERRAMRVLRLLLDRHTGLLVGIAHASRRGQLKEFDPKASARVDALRSIAWLGALLFFLGRNWEAYMDDTSFKLGQLLSAADAVHMGYCADRRGGDVPPTLVGNSVFSSAGRNPVKALAMLQQRMTPYVEWGKRGAEARQKARAITSQSQDNDAFKAKGDIPHMPSVRAARIYEGLRAYEKWDEVVAGISANLPTGSPSDPFRAALLLGYLAGLEPEPKSDSSDIKKEEITA